MTAVAALLASLIAPGVGHALTGNYVQAAVLGGLFALGKNALLPLSLRVFRVESLRNTLKFFYACNWCYIALIFYAAISAFWQGLHANAWHVWSALLYAVAIISVYKKTKSKIIFTFLCGRSGVYEWLQKMHQSATERK